MFKRRLVLALGVLGCLLLAGCELFQQPPVASFVVNYGVDPTDPMVVDLNASASSDPNGDAITAYMWTFGDDVTILTPLDTTKTVTVPVLRVRYRLQGAYAVQLLVRNELGETSTIVSGTVTLPHE
jgi:PKD repeat protein